MRTIALTIEGERLLPSERLAGQTGEHQDTALTVALPEEWAGCTCTLRFYVSNQNRHYQSLPLAEPVSFLLPQALMAEGELLVYLDARKDFTVHRTGPAALWVERSPDWCGAVCLAPDPYEGLVDKSLLEFEDALAELQRDVGDVSQLREDMTALAGQVTEDQAAVEKAAKQVAADRQEVETAHGEVKDWAAQTAANSTAAQTAAASAQKDTALAVESCREAQEAAGQAEKDAAAVSADAQAVSKAAAQVAADGAAVEAAAGTVGTQAQEVAAAHKEVEGWAGQVSADKAAVQTAAQAAAQDAASALESRNTVEAAAAQVQTNTDLVGQNTEAVTAAAAQVAQDKAAAQQAAEWAEEAAEKAAEVVEGFEGYTRQESDDRYAHALTGRASGDSVTLTDAQEGTTLLSLQVCGKTTLSGTPASDAPASITGACTEGTVTITAGGQKIVLSCPTLYDLPDGTADTVDAMTGQTVARIQVRVLDGTEAWYKSGGYSSPGVPAFGLQNASAFEPDDAQSLYCTHFTAASKPNGTAERIYLDRNLLIAVRSELLAEETAAGFQAWLAAQKAAGTPVTVLYPLYTPVETPGEGRAVPVPDGVISASGGAAVSVGYRKDTQKVIAGLLSRIEALEAQAVDTQIGG